MPMTTNVDVTINRVCFFYFYSSLASCCVSNVYARNRRTHARRDKVEALETDKNKFCHFNESECIRIDKRN